jgi:tetratricopeptide (TPR) repeat protein
MQKPVKLILIISIALVFILLMLITVWGGTIRMAQANHFFNAKNYDKAQDIYENLAVDQPTASNIQHNLGLCLYQVGLYERAVESFSKFLPKQSLSQTDPTPVFENAAIYYYHLGNALYKAASRNGVEPETAVKLYTAALDSYKKALLASPSDLQAKYNYELTVIHIKQLANKPQTQNQQQETENLMQNTQNSEQYKAKFIQNNNPPNGKDW